MHSETRILRTCRATILLTVLALFSSIAPLTASASGSSACTGCQVSTSGLVVDPASYKVWPSGSQTFVSVQWASTTPLATFNIKNLAGAPSQPLTTDVVVSNHDPITQTPVGSTTYTYPTAAIAAGGVTSIEVPLDSTQCDIFVSIDLGSGTPTVLRTGNPAAC